MNSCPLCLSKEASKFSKDKSREYFKCFVCDLVFVPKRFHLSEQLELSRYQLHRNDSKDERYQKYFQDFINKIMPFIENKSMRGLDYGCGESTLLADLLQAQGFSMSAFDPYFHANEKLLNENYDMVWMSEVWEHLNSPRETLNWLSSHLKLGGYWVMRTSLRPKDIEFNNWYYKNDPTHIIFSSEQTIKWISDQYLFAILKLDTPYILLKRHLN